MGISIGVCYEEEARIMDSKSYASKVIHWH